MSTDTPEQLAGALCRVISGLIQHVDHSTETNQTLRIRPRGWLRTIGYEKSPPVSRRR